MKKIIFILFILILNNSIIGEQTLNFFDEVEEILPANEVFKISFNENKDNLEISWEILDGYYLYLNSIYIKKGVNEVKYEILESELYNHKDEFFGETIIVRNKLRIDLKNHDINTKQNIEVLYQGCSDRGFCYPLQSSKA